VTQFVEKNADGNENEKRELARQAAVERGKLIVGEGAPVFDRGVDCANAEERVEERDEVEELHRWFVKSLGRFSVGLLDDSRKQRSN
jgi:hypothetical protein